MIRYPLCNRDTVVTSPYAVTTPCCARWKLHNSYRWGTILRALFQNVVAPSCFKCKYLPFGMGQILI